eukprot:7247267-Alexandrium_andersonii.AAC.1
MLRTLGLLRDRRGGAGRAPKPRRAERGGPRGAASGAQGVSVRALACLASARSVALVAIRRVGALP